MLEGAQLESAQCAVHADARATATCARCGNYACARCLVQDPRGQAFCEKCGPKALHATYFRHAWAIGLIGAVYFVAGVACLLVTVQMLFILSQTLASTSMTLDSPPMRRLSEMILVVFALASFLVLTGWKLRAFKRSARLFGLVPAAALLFAFPVGTLLALSAILLLLGRGGRFVFSDAYCSALRTQPTPKIVGPLTWVMAVLIVLISLLIQQYGSLSRVVSAFTT